MPDRSHERTNRVEDEEDEEERLFQAHSTYSVIRNKSFQATLIVWLLIRPNRITIIESSPTRPGPARLSWLESLLILLRNEQGTHFVVIQRAQRTLMGDPLEQLETTTST